MSSDPPPLDHTLRALVEAERSVGAAPAGGKAHVKARLDTLLAAPRGGGGRGGGGQAHGIGAGGVRLTRLAASFVTGAVVGGAVVYAVVAPRTVDRAVTIERPATPPSSPSVFAPVVEHAPSPSVDVEAPPRVTATAPPHAPGDSLAAERTLLDPARTALGRGDGARAMEAVRRHESSFRSGALTEEREAIAVQALTQLGRRDEARVRGERFLERYPASVLVPAVKAALEADR